MDIADNEHEYEMTAPKVVLPAWPPRSGMPHRNLPGMNPARVRNGEDF